MEQQQSSARNNSAQSTPIMQKMQFKMHHQRLKESENESASMMHSPMMDRRINKISTKAMSAMDLTNGPLENIQPNAQLSLMLHQQQKFPQQNHPMDQQMYQQFNQKPMLNQLMKVGPNHNASLADFRSIIHNQSVDDLIASRDQINAIVNAQKHSDYIVSDYMDKIQTRIALLETELKFADRKLHLLFSEYNEMLSKIEKLENLTIAQQSVLANLMDLCSNQSHEVSAAKAVQAKAAALFAVNQQDILLNQGESFSSEQYQQEVMVDSTQTEFNEMLEDLKNEAIVDGLRGLNRNIQTTKKTVASLPFSQIPQNFEDFEGDALLAMLENQATPQNYQFIRNLMGNDITGEQRDAIMQHLLQQQNAMELLKNLNEAQYNMDMEFFRSGELNKSLFSSLPPEPSVGQPSLGMIAEDNEEKADAKEASPVIEKTEASVATKKDDSAGSSSGNKKSKVKKKKHHQQLQQQHLQLQQTDDQLIHDIVEDILKIENMTNLLSKNQLDELKALIKNDLKHFQSLRKLDNNFLTLLVNPPLPMLSPNVTMSLEEEDQKFSDLMKKIKKNLDILKRNLEPAESRSPLSGSIYNDDEYFQSLKKSLDRHNSMQLLLHMQHPNLQSKSPSVLTSGDFLSDDQLDGGDSSSPPPPAPNGDSNFYYKSEPEDFSGLEQEWNPFHVDIMMMKEQKKKETEPLSSSSLSPYRISGQRSPKNAKSDSGLSSMSGFSSFERSPNSPSHSPYDQIHSRTGLRPTMSSQDYLRLLSTYQQMKLQSEAGNSQFLFSDLPSTANQPQSTDAMFSEENLNYIKELSQNVPICSIYENKSIFDNMTTIKTLSAWDHYVRKNQEAPSAEAQENVATFPDLILSQEEPKAHSSQPRLDALMEQKKILSQQKMQLKQEQLNQKIRKSQNKLKNLTDHLVYYPSPMSITDYNSSMNLEYQREFPIQDNQQRYYHQRDAQNVQHDEFMQSAHAQQQVHLQHMQQKQQLLQQKQDIDPNGPRKAGGSEKASYLNKVHAWLPDIKLKKMSKRHRSQSLPGEVDDEEYYAKQSYKMNVKKSSADESSGQSRGAKKKEIYVMKSYMKGKKKQLVHTMSNIMNKAKVYRRHSFSHHLSDEDENQSQQSSHHRGTRSASTAPQSKKSYSDTETDISSMFSDGDENDLMNDTSEADRNQQEPLPVFAIMGDSLPKHSDTGDSDRNSDRADSSSSSRKKSKENQAEPSNSEQNSFNLNFSSTSMEFAVSRKVGIFRKKSTVSDEPQSQVVTTSVSPVMNTNNFFEETAAAAEDPTPNSQPQFANQTKKPQPSHVLLKSHSIYVDSIEDENGVTNVKSSNGEQPVFQPRPPVPSPRFEHSRSSSMKGNSLDVPGYREDEDNKSQQSFRTISSSRRQSTEDSIDTDDEYFYYEMRNLEELERNSHMESILQDNKNEIINNIIQLDTSLGKCEHEPDESVKKKMGNVLHELKATVKLREAHCNDNRQDLVNNNKSRNIYDKFTMATNIQDMPWNRESDDEDDEYDDRMMDQLNQIETEMRDSSYGKVKKKRKKSKTQKFSPSSSEDEDEKSIPSVSPQPDDFHLHVDKFERHSQSSGVTSGPDSPIQSDDEIAEDSEKADANYDDFKERQKNERLLEHSQQPPNNQNDRGADESRVQSSENAATETEVKASGGEKPPLRKFMQLSSTISTDSTNQDSGISDTSGGAAVMSSKWKLLKTLKERKEMNNQVKIKEEEEGVKEKPVS